jgi:S1-C subfamily serine protease
LIQIVPGPRGIAIGLLFSALCACAAQDRGDRRGEIIAGSLDASVQLFTDRAGGAHRAGSGVVLATDRDGKALILTAAHLLEPLTDQIVEVVSPRTGERFGAAILASDADMDVAIVEATGLPVSPVALKPDARLGDDVWVISFPWGRRGTVVNGIVSQIAGDGSVVPFEGSVALIDAVVGYGTSGGGVFDDNTGDLIGIVRGYRTARLSLSGDQAQTLDLPIAGETTVIPTSDILCVLQSAGLADRLATGGARHEDGCTAE